MDQSHFKLSNLYNYKPPVITSINAQSYHYKLRVKCINEKGDYTLMPCQENEIVKPLNDGSDQDIINNFLHNYQISDQNSALKENEYYICENGKSQFSK